MAMGSGLANQEDPSTVSISNLLQERYGEKGMETVTKGNCKLNSRYLFQSP